MTDSERREGRISPENLERAVTTFREEGYLVVDELLPIPLIDSVKSAYMDALAAKIARMGLAPVDEPDAAERHARVKIRFEPKGGNHDVNRWNMHVPSRLPFFDPQLVGNGIVLQIVSHLVDDPVLFLTASDTPFPGSTFQNIHQDFPRFGMTLNIPLVDFTETNGPLELWPRSHRRPGKPFDESAVWHAEDVLAKIVETTPCQRMLLRKGSVLLRDQRLVHRGTHNSGDEPRPALSLWYKASSAQVPHRTVANLCQRASLMARERARRDGAVVDYHFLNKGNLAGRFVDETSNTDRDYRRRIPASVWRAFSDAAKRSMRFAEVESEPRPRGSFRADVRTISQTARFLFGRDFLG